MNGSSEAGDPEAFVAGRRRAGGRGLLPSAKMNEQTPTGDDPARREFDFWLGRWRVHAPGDELAGRSRIEAEYDGCVIHEQYESVRGFRGESLNIYDAGRRVWHQSWVDNTGALLLLEGGLVDGSMVLEGQVLDARGQAVRHRISWTPGADGSVRQHWQTADASGAWATAFDGRYTRDAAP